MSAHRYDQETMTALEAVTWAQFISFAPILFKAAVCLKRFGILKLLSENKEGLAVAGIAKSCNLSPYAVSVLLDAGLSARLILVKDNRYVLSKAGIFLQNDAMTGVNFDFVEDVCYEAMGRLDQSLIKGKPEGLKALGPWETIYPGLRFLPGRAKKSWFAYDHFYSDAAFNEALAVLDEHKPSFITDIGGNTGKFALRCVQKWPSCKVQILDLKEQIEEAKENVAKADMQERISFVPVNLLECQALPQGGDLWWMSQFLDCFSEQDIVRILKKVHAAATEDALVCIMELFWDNQRFEGAALALNATSLYFTAIANGCSRFYSRDAFLKLAMQAGFKLVSEHSDLGYGHTLLILRKS